MPTVIDRHAVQQLVQQGAQVVDVLAVREYEADTFQAPSTSRSRP